jgi:hypothetical protein
VTGISSARCFSNLEENLQMSKALDGWTLNNGPTYDGSKVGGPAHAEANQPKEAKGNSKAHEKSVRESGHTPMSDAARRPLEHNRAEPVPHAIPPIHRGAKGLDVTNAGKEQAERMGSTSAAARDWGHAGSTK